MAVDGQVLRRGVRPYRSARPPSVLAHVTPSGSGGLAAPTAPDLSRELGSDSTAGWQKVGQLIEPMPGRVNSPASSRPPCCSAVAHPRLVLAVALLLAAALAVAQPLAAALLLAGVGPFARLIAGEPGQLLGAEMLLIAPAFQLPRTDSRAVERPGVLLGVDLVHALQLSGGTLVVTPELTDKVHDRRRVEDHRTAFRCTARRLLLWTRG